MHLCSGFHNKVLHQVMLCNLYGPFPSASRHHRILAGLDRRCLRLEFEGGSLMGSGRVEASWGFLESIVDSKFVAYFVGARDL